MIETHAPDRALHAPGLLRAFNDAGILAAADVHVARRLAALGGESDDTVLLAAALAVRAPRVGDAYADLETIRETALPEGEEGPDAEPPGAFARAAPPDLFAPAAPSDPFATAAPPEPFATAAPPDPLAPAAPPDLFAPAAPAALPWPAAAEWLERVGRSPLVAVGEASEEARPLRLVGPAVYLDRYWRDERQIAADVLAFAAEPAAGVDAAVLADGLRRLFDGDGDERQRLAAATAVLRRFAVVAGGPGTGKTTTVARLVALLVEQADVAGAPPPLVGLAAPTAKAAARLGEAIREEAERMAIAPGVAERLRALEPLTLHRLLGRRPDSRSRFRHHRANRLPYDVVVVDETSMVSLAMMARLLEAVRSEARLVLVGDPGQLAAIEAGAVLGDIVGPATRELRMSPAARAALAEVTGVDVGAAGASEASAAGAEGDSPAAAGAGGDAEQAARSARTGVGDGVVVLDRVFRFGEGIAALADAVRRGDADATLRVLADPPEDVEWVGDGSIGPIRDAALRAASEVREAAAAHEPERAIDALAQFRLLCAHRRGEHGVAAWTERIEAWLAGTIAGFRPDAGWYVGRPLLVTENDYGLRLFNGDTGVVVAAEGGGVEAAFLRQGGVARFHPARLAAIETVYAMTVHKSQGSQFDTAAVVLPDPGSPLLTRELLYTAVTRAKTRLILAGTEEAVRAAVARPAARASGLKRRLWG